MREAGDIDEGSKDLLGSESRLGDFPSSISLLLGELWVMLGADEEPGCSQIGEAGRDETSSHEYQIAVKKTHFRASSFGQTTHSVASMTEGWQKATASTLLGPSSPSFKQDVAPQQKPTCVSKASGEQGAQQGVLFSTKAACIITHRSDLGARLQFADLTHERLSLLPSRLSRGVL